MPKIRITQLPKAKKGMVANGPCQPGYIKVDGECIPESTRNFTVYETDVPGEYTRTLNMGKPALMPNLSILGPSKWDKMSPSEQLAAVENGYDPYQELPAIYDINNEKDPRNDPELLATLDDLMNGREKENSLISRFARGRDATYNLDYTKEGFGPIAGTGLNWLRNIMYAPGAGFVTTLQGLRGDQNLTEENPNANTQAALDVTGMSNYPYLMKSLYETGDAYKNLVTKPSWSNAGNAGLSTVGSIFNILGSVPIVGAAETSAFKLANKEVPTLVNTLAPAFTKKNLTKTFARNPYPKNFGQFVANTPIINEAVGLANQGIHTIDNVMGVIPRAIAPIVNRTAQKTGYKLTDHYGAAPFIYGEHMWEGLTGTNPINYAADELLKPTVNYPVRPDSGMRYTPSTVPLAYSENNANLIAKDTTINLQSPSGKIYSIQTGSPQFQQLTGLINRDSANYDPKTQTFKLNKADFKSGDKEVDIDAFMDAFLPKKTYGGMNEIPNLFRYSPERNAPGRMAYGGIPRFIAGGTPPNCDPGYMVDPNDPDSCIEDPSFKLKYKVPSSSDLDPSDVPEMTTQEQQEYDQEKAQEKNRQNWLNKPQNEMSTYGWAQDFQDKFDLNPTYDPNKTYNRKGNEKKNFRQTINNGLDNFSSFYNRVATPLANAANMLTNYRRQKDFDTKSREARFDNQVVANTNHGLTEDPNNGLRRNNYGQIGYKWNNQASGYGNAEFGGEMGANGGIRIRITGGPTDAEQMAYGGQSGYGFDLGQRNTYAAMPQGKTQTVSNQIQEVPREEANIEAEKGETVYGDIDGDGADEHMVIGGKRHTEGGTPLNVPDGSFVFSDTKDMRIKDEASLAKFGLLPRKEGWTPAQIAKKYDINKYKAIIEDESSDEMMKSTAQLMVKNYQKKLAELALLQESMKGFPQGVPEMCRGILPDEMLDQIEQQLEQEKQQEGGGGQPEQGGDQQDPNSMEEYPQPMQDDQGAPADPMQDQLIDEEEVPGMMYGGDFAYGGDASYDRIVNEELGNIPKYQVAGTVKLKPGDADYDYNRGYYQLEDLMNDPKNAGLRKALFDKYKSGRGSTDNITEQEYIKDLLEAQQQKYLLRQYTKKNPTELTSRDWDTGVENSYYNTIANKYGFTPQSKEQILRSQNAYRDFADLSLADPNFQKTYGSQFGLAGIGVNDEDAYRGVTMTAPKGWRGNTDIGQLFYLNNDPKPNDTSVFGYICTGRDATTDVPQVSDAVSYADEAARTAAGAFATKDEAILKGCPPGTKTIPGDKFKCQKDPKTGIVSAVISATGYDTKEEALKHCPGEPEEIPFDYMTPDKWKMNAVRSRRLNKYLPFVADVPYEAANYLPEEWRAKAAELQSQTNDAARAMGAMGPAQGFAANLSAIQGKQARNLVGAIADVDARNVQGYNAFNRGEMARKDQFRALRAANQNERYKGNVIANQAYDNAYNKQLMDIADTDSNAWLNRMQLDMENQTNRNYYTDPWQGRLHFRRGKSVDDLGKTSSDDGENFRDWQIKNRGADGTYPTYSDYQKAKSKKYGGGIDKKQNNSGNLGDMLSRGYSFPF